jgi:hypothetical protein
MRGKGLYQKHPDPYGGQITGVIMRMERGTLTTIFPLSLIGTVIPRPTTSRLSDYHAETHYWLGIVPNRHLGCPLLYFPDSLFKEGRQYGRDERRRVFMDSR